jgi:hypothetical protein
MKMTVVTAKDGTIVAAHHGEMHRPDTNTVTQVTDWRGGLLAGPEQKLHVVDVPEAMLSVTSPAEVETQLKAILAKASK